MDFEPILAAAFALTTLVACETGMNAETHEAFVPNDETPVEFTQAPATSDHGPNVVSLTTSASKKEVIASIEGAAASNPDFEVRRHSIDSIGHGEGPTRFEVRRVLDPQASPMESTRVLGLPSSILVEERVGETHVAFYSPDRVASSYGSDDGSERVEQLDAAVRDFALGAVKEVAVLADSQQRDSVDAEHQPAISDAVNAAPGVHRAPAEESSLRPGVPKTPNIFSLDDAATR